MAQEKFIEALIMPSAKSLGTHLKYELDTVLAKRREHILEKERENIYMHIEALKNRIERENITNIPSPTSEKLAAIYEWAEGAKKELKGSVTIENHSQM